MAPTASVVVPTHDAEETLGEQLTALAQQVDAPEFDVVVALNRCADGSRSVAERYGERLPLRVVDADAALGPSHARNVGAAAASAPLLLFCDADDRVGPRWVAEMATAMTAGGADLVGGRVVVDRSRTPEWVYRVRYRSFDGTVLTPYGPGMLFPIGAAMGCRRSAFDAVGGFDEQLVGGADEIDFAARVLRAGFRLGEAPEATVSYRPRPTARAALRQARGYARGAAILAAKEGVLTASGRPAVFWRTAKTAAALVAVERVRRPRDLVLRTVVRYHYAEEERRLAARTGGAPPRDPGADDFVVPLGTPVVGGLALEARAADVPGYVGGRGAAALGLLAAVLRPGDAFIDGSADIGLSTVAAAELVGPGGRVLAFEPHPEARRLLARNLRRHRVDDRVEIRSAAVSAALAEAAALARTRTAWMLRADPDTPTADVLDGTTADLSEAGGIDLWLVDEARPGRSRRLTSLHHLREPPPAGGAASRHLVIAPASRRSAAEEALASASGSP